MNCVSTCAREKASHKTTTEVSRIRRKTNLLAIRSVRIMRIPADLMWQRCVHISKYKNEDAATYCRDSKQMNQAFSPRILMRDGHPGISSLAITRPGRCPSSRPIDLGAGGRLGSGRVRGWRGFFRWCVLGDIPHGGIRRFDHGGPRSRSGGRCRGVGLPNPR